MRVAGASQFVNQAILANKQGIPAVSTSVLGEATGGASLLDIGRAALPHNGIGLSRQARALNNQLLKDNSTVFNQIFSLTGGGSATIDAARTQILALKSSTPVSRTVQAEAPQEDASRGALVDESV